MVDSFITREMLFEDNRRLSMLFGDRDAHLHRIADALGVSIMARGNLVRFKGPESAVTQAQEILSRLDQRIQDTGSLRERDVDTLLRQSVPPKNSRPLKGETIKTWRNTVEARTMGQAAYIQALQSHEIVFALGPAGTGKTFLAVAVAVSFLLSKQVKRLILSRPAIEAGERLGFLPGDLKDKVDPYLRPLYDALYDTLPPESLPKRLESREIEVAPLAYMRGRTLGDAFIILDEAQNTTEAQMKLFLTRMGKGSRMVITGDPTQIDLAPGIKSGLHQAQRLLKDIPGIHFSYLTPEDIVRHPMVKKIVEAYDQAAR